MSRNYLIIIFIQLLCALSALAINHWILRDGLKITPKIDSPFYMNLHEKEHNLMAFLEQITLNENIEASYLELLRQREQIVQHLRFSIQFGENLVEQAKCAMDYYLKEKRVSYLKISSAYKKRFNWSEKEQGGAGEKVVKNEPICTEYVKLSSDAYEHLECFKKGTLDNLHLEPEEMSFDDVTVGEKSVRLLVLAQDTKSWKFHTLASYYWRVQGNHKYALDCARVGIMLAPHSHKDIPLLSLGIILYRMGRMHDADIILSEAVQIAPTIAENHIALASAMAMKHDFNRSLHHFDEAERLNPSLLPRTLPIRNFITCLENLMTKTTKMYSYVEYMKNEVKEFKKLKYQISQKHEKLIQQQVPLGSRDLDPWITNEDLQKRGQYCSTRTLSTSEPMLFCDFYSDMHIRLDSKDVDIESIESLERDLRLTSEAVVRQVSTEIGKQLNYDKIKSVKAQVPTTTSNGETVSSVGGSNKGKDK